MNRFKWPVPSHEYFRRNITEGESLTIEYRLDRYRFIWAEFGPPADMLLIGGIPAMFAIEELKCSFVYGNFMATVLLAQAFVEQSLAGSYSLSGNDEVASKGFSRLINAACQDGIISAELAKSFHDLRRMRNPYTHHIIGTGERSYMGRLLQSEFSAPEDLVLEDAKFALTTVVDYLRYGSPNWNPENMVWNENDA